MPFGASGPRVFWGSAAPTSGTYNTGDIVWDSNPAVGSPSMWICMSGGSPGTWYATHPLPNGGSLGTLNTTSAVLTVSNGYRYVFLAGTNSGTTVLPDVTSHAQGWTVTFVNSGTNSATLAANASNSYAGAAAITLAAAGVITIIAGAGTLWYKVA